MLGRRGTGKTQMAACLITDACQQLQTAKYTTAMEFFMAVRECYRSDGRSERQVIESYCQPRLLVIDELGVRAESHWEDSMLTYLVDRRYAYKLDTIVISNQTEKDFTESAGSSIVDRLRETGGIIEFSWSSFRQRDHGAAAGGGNLS